MLTTLERYKFHGYHTDLILREQIVLGEPDRDKWLWIVEESNPGIGTRRLFAGSFAEADAYYEGAKDRYR